MRKLIINTKVENDGATPEGKLFAAEINQIVQKFNSNIDSSTLSFAGDGSTTVFTHTFSVAFENTDYYFEIMEVVSGVENRIYPLAKKYIDKIEYDFSPGTAPTLSQNFISRVR